MYSIQCGYYKVYEKPHPERVTSYKHIYDNLNWDDINFPVDNNGVKRLERITKPYPLMYMKHFRIQLFLTEEQQKNTAITSHI